MSDRELRVFNGATGIVTGGAPGIGRALGEELATRGCEVVLADLQIELAEAVTEGVRVSVLCPGFIRTPISSYPLGIGCFGGSNVYLLH